MATSSIFADFSIKNTKTAEAFVDALDKSAQHVHDMPKGKPIHQVTDPIEINALFANRKRGDS